ncbi:MAG TPA: STAS domain-containing protein [bacterium]|nr:STAS domain-containing protein [bacterium]HQG47046.1 STAS domain-containing protein [bacterium]HQI49634.1 STAS domain-containing protein [bacterium]HQJ65668.1 STAS domain-containing protein [bacterium]
MALSEVMHGDVAVLELKGKLMGGPETVEIHDKVKQLIGQGAKKVVADVNKVTWMNSTGLGALIGAMSSLRNAGGDLKLARITENVENLFVITKLVTIFDTFDSVEEAVTAFK